MSLDPGATIGPYEITAKLGEGGMGEVYRARDAKLERDVAIKVLPAAFVEDHERLQRFEREAKLLAQLNHPNIAHIYGMEASGDSHALVMELVEGPTLAERLESGPLPLEEALSLARQIADGLEEAHGKGIIHRDLKPQNVKVSSEGKVKVLDFGLAKAMDPVGTASGPGSASQLAASPTLTLGATQQGLVLGTAAYMAPEQAKGLAVDKRADIWTFGVVLWEMLTGRRLFDGDSVPETLAGVLKEEIDLGVLLDDVPPSIRHLLRRCLERNPKNRLHDIADARIVLDDVLSGRTVDSPEPLADHAEPEPRGRVVRRLALGFLLLAAGGAAGWFLRPEPAPRTFADSRWMLALPEGTSLSTDDEPHIAISRDGREQAAVVLSEQGVPQIAVRRSDAFEPQLLSGTENATAPFFSPDGTWIGFFRDGALMKIPAEGGAALRVANIAAVPRGGTWSEDGWIYFSDAFAAALSRVRPRGGEVEAVTHLDTQRNERTHRWPQALPGGDAILFTNDSWASSEYYDDARIEAVRPATGERRVLIEGASQARFVPGGFLAFARGGSLFAVRFDPHTLTVRGTPVEVARGVATDVGSGAVQFAISENGVALWAPGGLTASYRVVWVDHQGHEKPVEVPPAPYNELALSPDGTRLALVGGPAGISDLWVADLARGSVTRLTAGEIVHMPAWTPDSSRIAYAAAKPAVKGVRTRIDWQLADGSRSAETLVEEGPWRVPSSFTPDGRFLLYDQDETPDGTVHKLWALSLDGKREVRALSEGERPTASAAVSPDGHWMAYVSGNAGQANVYVRRFPEVGGRWQISTSAASEPRWAPDGRSLFYRSNAVLYRVAVDTSHGFHAGRPEPLIDRVATGDQVHSYSLSPDGSRTITFRTAEGSGAQHSLNLDLGFARRVAAPLHGER